MLAGIFEQQITDCSRFAFVGDLTRGLMLFPVFRCQKCGKNIDLAPAVCVDCCEDHDYQYERELHGHYCLHCGKKAPDDFYYD